VRPLRCGYGVRDDMTRLVVVSNRVARIEEGRSTSGGLAVGVLEALRESGGLWFGWSGDVIKRQQARPTIQHSEGLTFATIGLSQSDHRRYYLGFSNRVLWPVLHYRPDLMEFRRAEFDGYRDVNAMFASKLERLLEPDDRIWVHDYHLIPLAAALRQRHVKQPIGFFLHTPFPVYEVLRTLPYHEQILEWLCRYDLVGFQTEADAAAFRHALTQVTEGRSWRDGRVEAFGMQLRTGAFPIGVDTDAIAASAPSAARTPTVERFKRSVFDRHIIVGVDRLDYSKGLERRFRDYVAFLERYPEYRGSITYLQIAPPTRSGVPEYRELQRTLSQRAGEIVGRFSEPDWTPIRYLNRSFTRRTLLGFFRISRIGLVTPLRDGMNLVAKEYVAAQNPEDPGVLILSPFAGATAELSAALIVNPLDPDALAEAIQRGLQMSRPERRERWQAMFQVLRRNNVGTWRDSFLRALAARSSTVQPRRGADHSIAAAP
jgi:trehalose 6-phosphate synthase